MERKKYTTSTIKICTEQLCKYGCGQVAKYQFSNGSVCCSSHCNSCPAKRKQFSETGNHKENNRKSLETRTKLGITKSSQIKGGSTRRANGHYKKLKTRMQQLWNTNPWQNNLHCPLAPYKNTILLYQGSYEFNFLRQLEEIHGIDWLTTNVSRGPSLWFVKDSVKKLYISDFIIGNTVYEIKSNWTWNNKGKNQDLEDMNNCKLTECLKKGYNVILVLEGTEIKYGD